MKLPLSFDELFGSSHSFNNCIFRCRITETHVLLSLPYILPPEMNVRQASNSFVQQHSSEFFRRLCPDFLAGFGHVRPNIERSSRTQTSDTLYVVQQFYDKISPFSETLRHLFGCVLRSIQRLHNSPLSRLISAAVGVRHPLREKRGQR